MENVTSDAVLQMSNNNNTDKCVSDFILENLQDLSGELAINASVARNISIDFLFHGLGILFLAVVGITANVLSVIVLAHPRLKSSLNTLLLGLTISDIFVISSSFLIFSLSPILEHVQLFSWYISFGRPFLLPLLLPIALTAQMCSLYFTVVITLERYVAVCLPLQARSLCTRSSAKWSSLAIVSTSILYNLPRWFEFQAVPKTVNCTTGHVIAYVEKETTFRTNEFYVTFYVNWAYLVFFYLVPFTILVYFNIAIYRQAKLHRSLRNSLCAGMTSNSNCSNMTSSEDIQLASMLLGIVITFIACNMLPLVVNVMENFGMAWDWLGTLIPINDFLVVLGCSTNFIFYCVFGTEFRRRLRLTLRIKRRSVQSSTKSEIWSEKDYYNAGANNSSYNRTRSESLQIPHLGPGGPSSRSRSNSSCVVGGSTTKYGSDDAAKVKNMSSSSKENNCNRSLSIDMRSCSQLTDVSVIADEV